MCTDYGNHYRALTRPYIRPYIVSDIIKIARVDEGDTRTCRVTSRAGPRPLKSQNQTSLAVPLTSRTPHSLNDIFHL